MRRADPGELACESGYAWVDHLHHTCPGCLKDTLAGIRAFREAVAVGEYDEDGYTPAERWALKRDVLARL